MAGAEAAAATQAEQMEEAEAAAAAPTDEAGSMVPFFNKRPVHYARTRHTARKSTGGPRPVRKTMFRPVPQTMYRPPQPHSYAKWKTLLDPDNPASG
eukprot:COSAG01_NODE_38487_length_489_cov_0.546154_1_plen_96_part_01